MADPTNHNVTRLRDEGHCAIEAELAKRIKLLLLEYERRISLAQAIGVLEIVKTEMYNGQQ